MLGRLSFAAMRLSSRSVATAPPPSILQSAQRKELYQVPPIDFSGIDIDFDRSLTSPKAPPADLPPPASNILPSVNLEKNFASLQKRILSVRRTVKVTKSGKVQSMSVLVVVGNGKGAVGYGEGKSSEMASAVLKATNKAIKDMVVVDRYDERTVLTFVQGKVSATRVELRPSRPGYGLRVNFYIHEVARCAGILDLAAKVYGSRNPINVVKATVEALQAQKPITDIAIERGLQMMDLRKVYYGT